MAHTSSMVELMRPPSRLLSIAPSSASTPTYCTPHHGRPLYRICNSFEESPIAANAAPFVTDPARPNSDGSQDHTITSTNVSLHAQIKYWSSRRTWKKISIFTLALTNRSRTVSQRYVLYVGSEAFPGRSQHSAAFSASVASSSVFLKTSKAALTHATTLKV